MSQTSLDKLANSSTDSGRSQDSISEEAKAVAGEGGTASQEGSRVETQTQIIPEPGTDGQQEDMWVETTGETSDVVELMVSSIDYKTATRNGSEEAVLHIHGRKEADNGKGDLVHVEIVGFDSYFYILNKPSEIEKAREKDGVVDIDFDTDDSIRSRDVARVLTQTPYVVGQIRDDFETHFEADILFPDRFLIDKGITSGIRVAVDDTEETHHRVHHTDVTASDVRANPRVQFFDIEVEDRNGFPENGTEPVLCLTSHDNFDDEYIIWVNLVEGVDPVSEADIDYDPINEDELDYHIRTFESEEAMLEAYLDYLEATDPTILSGWNFEDFDLTYLLQRLDNLDGDRSDDALAPERLSRLNYWKTSNWGPDIKGRTPVDLLYAYKRTQFTEKDSYRLDAIGEDELGVGKETYIGDIGALWEDDLQKLLEYNLRDVEICVELNREQEILDFWEEVRGYTGCQLPDAPTPSDAVDMYILQKVSNRYVLPSKSEQNAEDYTGGAVLEPFNGVESWVGTLDLKSLYPMCMLTLNASPETKVDPDTYDGETYTAPNGIHFRKDQDGILKEIIVELLEERDAKKTLRDNHEPGTEEYEKYDRQQAAIKVVMNSLYGVLGFDRFRLYDKDIGAAVTATGREVIEYTRDEINKREGLNVVYGDTDSCLVSFPADLSKDELLEAGFELEDHLNEKYDEFAKEELNAESHRFEMEFEKLYKRYFQAGKKKRYAGHVVWAEGNDVDKVGITGFEAQRSDTADITQKVQTEVIEMILHGADESEIINHISGMIEEFDAGDIPLTKVGISGGINKHIRNYKTKTAHVRGAEYANLIFGTNFRKGSKPQRIYLNGITPDLKQSLEEEIDETPAQNTVYGDFLRNPDVICYEYPEQVRDGLQIDWQKQRNKTLKGPLERILSPIGITWSEVVSGQQQRGLSDWVDS